MQNITVHRQAGRFCGWPANFGIWQWGDEIVTGFTLGYHQPDKAGHSIDPQQPIATMQARSLDGGLTWETAPVPAVAPGAMALSADEHHPHRDIPRNPAMGSHAPQPLTTPLDFAQPDFALLCARTDLHGGAVSWFYASSDRCHTWQGPYALPMFGQTGVSARTDYVVRGAGECTLFLTGAKTDGREGHVFCARTRDGGLNFEYLAPVGPQNPPGFSIMPASVRLPDGTLLCALRCQDARTDTQKPRAWIELHQSDDDGHTWRYLSMPTPDNGGNPPALLHLHDGRLALIYGYRHAPYGLRARLSSDAGRTWDDEVVLRDDAGCWDLGYPRAVQRPDGTVVVVAYYNDHAAQERYITATLWRP